MDSYNLIKKKWYLKTWVLCILFALWFLYGVPLLVGILLLIFKLKEEKALDNQISELVTDNQRYIKMLTPEMQDAVSLQKYVDELHKEEESLNIQIHELNSKINELNSTIEQKKGQLVYLDEEIVVQEFGLYTPQFDFASALDYKEELAKVRALQKILIKNKIAVTGTTNWTVDGNKAKGKKMVSDTQKLLLRAFNTECDEIISKVKYRNEMYYFYNYNYACAYCSICYSCHLYFADRL